MTHPYLALISGEIDRAEADLAGFRARALTVLTTSAGIVTLFTGLTTFAASKATEDAGLSGWPVALIGISLAGFVVAALVALAANMPKGIRRPSIADLADATSRGRWDDGTDESEKERVVAEVMVAYLRTLRAASDTTATRLRQAIGCQIFGLVFASASVVVTVSTL